MAKDEYSPCFWETINLAMFKEKIEVETTGEKLRSVFPELNHWTNLQIYKAWVAYALEQGYVINSPNPPRDMSFLFYIQWVDKVQSLNINIKLPKDIVDKHESRIYSDNIVLLNVSKKQKIQKCAKCGQTMICVDGPFCPSCKYPINQIL